MSARTIRHRQEAERRRIEAYEATLRRVSRAPRPAPDFGHALEEARRGFGDAAIRDGQSWRPRLKTRDPARLRLAAARHLYARYKVPACLEAIWLDQSGLDEAQIALRKRWYVIAARGGSLWKEAAGAWLTRKETHRFLDAPGTLGFDEAFWYAIALGHTDDEAIAQRIAGSRIVRQPRAELTFWREVARFFCVLPAPRAEMDDLCDHLAERHRRDPAFSLQGRTLASLARQMREWHRDLGAVARIELARRRAAQRQGIAEPPHPGDRRWPGSPLADWAWQARDKGRSGARERFEMVQLRTAVDLVEETRAMHHCVSTYAPRCIAGHASIWSLRRRVDGRAVRLLTIEVDARDRAVQLRGPANRLPTGDEMQVVSRWARERGVVLA